MNSEGECFVLFFSVCSSCYYYCCLEGDVPTIPGTSQAVETVQDWLRKIACLFKKLHKYMYLLSYTCHNNVPYFEIHFVRRKSIVLLPISTINQFENFVYAIYEIMTNNMYMYINKIFILIVLVDLDPVFPRHCDIRCWSRFVVRSCCCHFHHCVQSAKVFNYYSETKYYQNFFNTCTLTSLRFEFRNIFQ